MLRDRAELDSQFGRTALGVLLIQDAAVVPLVFIVTALSSGGSLHQIAGRMVFLVGLAGALIGVFYLLFSRMMPRVLVMSTWRRNRDLPVLLTVCMAGGAAWSAHALQLSPALGAFLAGVLLAVSPYATQIQADVQPLRSVLVTLFIAAIGMFGDVDWFVQHIGIVAVALVAIVGLKLLIVTVLTWAARLPLQFAVATGCCLAQIGEFSFVLAMIVRGDAAERSVMSEPVFQAMVSATLLSLFATPYLIAAGPRWGSRLERELRRYGAWTRTAETPAATAGLTAAAAAAAAPTDVILILGFGPAGQRVAEELLAAHRDRLVVVDLNIDNIAVAHRYGILAHVGDATQTDILEHVGIHRAHIVVITLPSPSTARRLIQHIRHLVPSAMLARARPLSHPSLGTAAGRSGRGGGRGRPGGTSPGTGSPSGIARLQVTAGSATTPRHRATRLHQCTRTARWINTGGDSCCPSAAD